MKDHYRRCFSVAKMDIKEIYICSRQGAGHFYGPDRGQNREYLG